MTIERGRGRNPFRNPRNRFLSLTLVALLVIQHLSGSYVPVSFVQAEDGQLLGRVVALENELEEQKTEQQAGEDRQGGQKEKEGREICTTEIVQRIVGKNPVEGTHFSFPEDVDRKNLTGFALSFYEPRQLREGTTKWANCTGEECPSFGGCKGPLSGASACWSERMFERRMCSTGPKNCPLTKKVQKGGTKPDDNCSHQSDYYCLEGFKYQIYRFQNMFIDPNGVTFNNSVFFGRGSCAVSPLHPFRAGTRVRYTKRAINWLMGWTVGNFYHTLTESMVQLYLLALSLRDMPDIPLLGTHMQWDFYRQIYEPLIGIPLKDINHISIEHNDMVYAAEVYQPVYPPCLFQSRTLWSGLRSKHILPKDGIPIFGPGWIERLAPGVPLTDPPTWPSDWTILILERPDRAVPQMDQIRRQLIDTYSKGRVVTQNGSLPILQALALFARAVVLLGPHGAALSNLVFLPHNASLIEIRPKDYPISSFTHLATACSIDFNLVFTDGDKGNKSSPWNVDPKQVLALVHSEIRQRNLPGVTTS